MTETAQIEVASELDPHDKLVAAGHRVIADLDSDIEGAEGERRETSQRRAAVQQKRQEAAQTAQQHAATMAEHRREVAAAIAAGQTPPKAPKPPAVDPADDVAVLDDALAMLTEQLQGLSDRITSLREQRRIAQADLDDLRCDRLVGEMLRGAAEAAVDPGALIRVLRRELRL